MYPTSRIQCLISLFQVFSVVPSGRSLNKLFRLRIMWPNVDEFADDGFTHVRIFCDVCERVISRMRYQCCECEIYDLCHTCYYSDEHDTAHSFKLFASPTSPGVQLRPRNSGGKWNIMKMKWRLQRIFTRTRSGRGNNRHSADEDEDLTPSDIICHGCNESITGNRYKCCVCFGYDLCEDCYNNGEHEKDHAFKYFISNTAVGIHLRSRDTDFISTNVTCKSCVRPVAGRIYVCCTCTDYKICRECYHVGEHNADHAFERIDPDTALRVHLRPRDQGVINSNFICDGCDEGIPDIDIRYRCCVCSSYDLCQRCYDDGEHDAAHTFQRFDSTTSAGVRLTSHGRDVADPICDGCEEHVPLGGGRYKCWACPDYNLCVDCYDDGEHDAAHAFRLFDTSTSSWYFLPPRNGNAYSRIICDGCNKYIPITGRRHKCWECADYDLCLGCYDAGHHDDDHPFKLFDSSTSSWLDLPSREDDDAWADITCDRCKESISGNIYKCCICSDYDVCSECYNCGEHDATHSFERFDSDMSVGVPLPPHNTGATHLTVICDGCEKNIIDRRYKCWICPDYDLCLECYDANHHDAAHPFKLFDSSTSSWLDLPSRENDAEDLNIYCNVCHRDISDMRYKCSVCLDYQLCYVCYENGEHDTTHMFQLFDLTTSLGLDLPLRENAAGESGVCCNVCNQNISDMRYKCSMCSDYQLCYICYENGEHDLTHRFTIFDATTSSGLDLPLRENDVGHPNVCCKVCRQDISDMRYKCSICSDYQLCDICYENGEHDLTHQFKLFDSTTSSGLDLPLRGNDFEHPHICCNVCNQDISDMRYKCTTCTNYQLCYVCYENGNHDTTHFFQLFDSTTSPGLDLPLRENDVQYVTIICNNCHQDILCTRYQCGRCSSYDLCTTCYHADQHHTNHPFYYFDTVTSLGFPLRPRNNDVNRKAFCDACNFGISRRRYKCSTCSDYNLCRECYRSGKHDPAHPFKRFTTISGSGVDLPPRKSDVKHPLVKCSNCNNDISGMRYKCCVCLAYYLCHNCYYDGKHHRDHPFKLFDSTTSSGIDLSPRIYEEIFPWQQTVGTFNRERTNENRYEDQTSEQNHVASFDALNVTENANQSCTSSEESDEVSDQLDETGNSSQESSSKDKPINNKPEECQVCSELSEENVRLEPCNHKLACESCSAKMKKCFQCGVVVKERITKDGRIIPATDGQADAEQVRHLESKIAEIEESQSCSICMDRKRNVVFLCGHSACSECAAVLEWCHMCRRRLRKKISLY